MPKPIVGELIQGAVGVIEVIADTVESPDAPLAIICHPHPLFGGTMHNKVVTTLARAFSECGAHTVRFNFRGVGLSAGQHDEGVGELDDLLAVVAWARVRHPNSVLWLAGFSFGGWIAVKGALRLPAEQLILIAPQVSRLSQEDVSSLPCPWMLVQGEQDDVVSPEDVFAWVASLSNPPQLIRIAEAGHFFHGQLTVLRELLMQQLNDQGVC